MNSIRTPIINATALALLCLALGPAQNAHAGNDPSIKSAARKAIQASMEDFIEARTIGGVFHIFDPVTGRLLDLRFKKLHRGIVRKGGFYVSCADFVDPRGKKYDLDFLVAPDGEAMRTLQAIIHSVGKKKVKYHLESTGPELSRGEPAEDPDEEWDDRGVWW